MTPEQLKELTNALTTSIDTQVKLTVNGKIERLLKSHEEMKESFLRHMEEDRVTAQKMDDYISQDNGWKLKAQPIIELGENISWSTMAILKTLGALGTIAGIIAVIFNLSKK